MTQAERDALDMASHFEDSGSIARTIAECCEYIDDQCWDSSHAKLVIEEYKKLIFAEGYEAPR